MGIENPKIYSKQAKSRMEETRARVDSLRHSDHPHEDSVYDLAEAEGDIREEMQSDGMPGDLVKKYANRLSNTLLEKAEAERDNWVDGLTGLRNQEAIMGEVPSFFGSEKRRGGDCSILMIDFDNFKSINDTFGHPAGNQALQAMAEVIRDSVRRSDFVYRFGGDEFTVVLMDTPSQVAKEIAEKIRKSVDEYTIIVDDEKKRQQQIKRTVSVGCIGTDQLESWKKATDDDMKQILEEMIRKADGSLYDAKEKGKQNGSWGNYVIAYNPEEDKQN